MGIAIGKKPIAQEHIDPADVRETLEHIVASDIFRTSPQLIEFLRYVVDATLRGEGGRLKALTIGIDVLGRGSDFDPQLDPIVSVEATRLRHAIERYYAGPGTEEKIVINIPRGTYAPAFYRRQKKAGGVDAVFRIDRVWRQFASSPLMVILFVAAVTCAAGIALIARQSEIGDDNTASISKNSSKRPLPLLAGNGMPTLEIDQIKIFGLPDSQSLSATALQTKMQEIFSRFDAINISAIPTGDTLLQQEKPALNIKPRAEYRLIGEVRYRSDRTSSIDFRLIDLRNQTVVWSKIFDQLVRSQNGSMAEMKIAAEVAQIILQPFGVIRAHERLRMQTASVGDPRYRCIIETFDAFRSFDEAEHIRARDCLERLTTAGPEFAVGLPYLAAIYNREYLFGFGARAGDMPAMDRALVAARRGVELAPSSARAYQSLFVVLFNRKDIAAAFAAGDRALILNPYDPNIVSEYGGRLILNGEIDRGLSMMRQAAAGSPVRPSWHHYFMFLGNYFKNNLADATFHAEQLPGSYPLGFLARALAASAAGDVNLARMNYNRLVENQPEFGKSARRWLEKFFPKTSLVDRILSDLSAAGLIKGS